MSISSSLLIYKHFCSAREGQTSTNLELQGDEFSWDYKDYKLPFTHPTAASYSCNLSWTQIHVDSGNTELTSACQLSQQELLPLLIHFGCKGFSKPLETVMSQEVLNPLLT